MTSGSVIDYCLNTDLRYISMSTVDILLFEHQQTTLLLGSYCKSPNPHKDMTLLVQVYRFAWSRKKQANVIDCFQDNQFYDPKRPEFYPAKSCHNSLLCYNSSAAEAQREKMLKGIMEYFTYVFKLQSKRISIFSENTSWYLLFELDLNHPSFLAFVLWILFICHFFKVEQYIFQKI